MQPSGINHPVYKVIFGVVAIVSLFNVWLLHSLTQAHCAQLNLALVKISIGSMCPLASQGADPIAAYQTPNP